jgi:hypothetical protein
LSKSICASVKHCKAQHEQPPATTSYYSNSQNGASSASRGKQQQWQQPHCLPRQLHGC